jgi:hypothetical protein
MLTSSHRLVLFAVVLEVYCSQGDQTLDEANTCFDHAECQADAFCAWSISIDSKGRNISCGICKKCIFCRCDVDSIDSACPQSRCPDQPSQGVRYLQGVFLGHARLKYASHYICTRRLTMSGATIAFLQSPVHDGHPASHAMLNISSAAAADCPSVALSGVIIESTATMGPDRAVSLRVSITSDGALMLVARPTYPQIQKMPFGML